jgi:dihydrofolate reductase
MRHIIVNEFLSLDGVMQAPGSPDEDRRGGFELGGWHMQYGDDEMTAAALEAMDDSDGFLLGRRTYEIFASYWPSAPEDNPFTERMNRLAKYVVSETLDEVTWNNSTLLEGDAAEAITELKAQPGKDLQVLGSGKLVRTLMEHDLVDEYNLMVDPVVLGRGKRLFGDGVPTTALQLVDAETTDTGTAILTYRPDADGVKRGDSRDEI